MANIKIKFKDGTIKEFKHEGRSGGSYTKRLTYEGAFAIVEDEWGKRTAFPSQDIESVEETPNRY
jgi:hypothetical protein